jgi:hypothetical protein
MFIKIKSPMEGEKTHPLWGTGVGLKKMSDLYPKLCVYSLDGK